MSRYYFIIIGTLICFACSTSQDSQDTQSRRFDFQKRNEFYYEKDKEDIWLTPEQFKERGYGDCEDFAIYWCEKYKNFNKTALVLVRHKLGLFEDHAVTLIDDTWVLDILEKTPVLLKNHHKKWNTLVQFEDCGREMIKNHKGLHLQK